MLTFNDVPLAVPTTEVAARVSARISWADIIETSARQWASQSYAFDALPPGYFGENEIEVGTLQWPVGASRWASGHFLVHTLDAAEMVALVGQAGTLKMTWEEHATRVQAGRTILRYDSDHYPITTVKGTVSATVYLLSLRPLNIGDGGEVYLATFVDQRFFWWAKNTGSITVTEGTTTWANLYTTLGSALGVSIAADSIHADYTVPSALANLRYEPVPPWLDTVAQNVGQRIVCSLTGAVSALSPLTADIDLAVDLVGGGTFYGSTLGLRPSAILTAFPKFLSSAFQGGYEAVNTPLGGSGGTQTFKPMVKATVDGAGAVTNSAVLAAYAAKLSADLYSWNRQTADAVLPGIQDVAATGFHGNIKWTYLRDELTTRVQYAPYDWREPAGTSGVTSASTGSVAICVSTCLTAAGSPPVAPAGLLAAALYVSTCLTAAHQSVASPSASGLLTAQMCVSACLTSRVSAPTIVGTASEINVSYLAGTVTIGLVDPLAATKGGTGQSTIAVGDLLYGTATNVISKLPLTATPKRYLTSDGQPGNLGWDQVSLTAGVFGVLPAANGGGAYRNRAALCVKVCLTTSITTTAVTQEDVSLQLAIQSFGD